MKQIFIFLLVSTSITSYSQTQADQAEMKRMLEAMTPNDNHTILAGMAGDWNYTWEMIMPGSPLMESKGEFKNTMILGGRFLQMENTSEGFMGMPLNGLSIFGYDNRSKKFTIYGVDSWGTYSVYAEGDYDPSTQTFTLFGEDHDPRINKTQQFQFVYKMIDANTMESEVLFADEEGIWDVVMAVHAIRK
ncbi:MAG: DUF1579 family protein [Chitinophagales bacterium]|nr:DUF1579 family protein [Chitinophagales bacterium]